LSNQCGLAWSWDGTAWSVVPSPNRRGTYSNLNGVSCVSATSCTAAGAYHPSRGGSGTVIESWNGTAWSVLDRGLVEFARDLKQQRGGDVGIHASISVAQALLAADVVDELRLVIAPRIAGRGRRLFEGLPSIRLESMRSEISPTGYLLVDYRVIR
jgi:hypothetical protein